MLVALWAGATIMSFFGVSLSALRIAGGLWSPCGLGDAVDTEENEDRKQEQRARATGAGDVAFFPLTMPFTTGPVRSGRDRAQRQPAVGHARPHSAFRRSFGRGGDGRRHGGGPLLCLCGPRRRASRPGSVAHRDAPFGFPSPLHRRANIAHRGPERAVPTAQPAGAGLMAGSRNCRCRSGSWHPM